MIASETSKTIFMRTRGSPACVKSMSVTRLGRIVMGRVIATRRNGRITLCVCMYVSTRRRSVFCVATSYNSSCVRLESDLDPPYGPADRSIHDKH